MKITHQIYLVSDSTGETIERIFTALKAQFSALNTKNINFHLLEQKIKLMKL